MGWWLVGATAAVAGLVLTLELSQISEDYSNYLNTSETKPQYEIIEVEDTASKLTFWERRCVSPKKFPFFLVVAPVRVLHFYSGLARFSGNSPASRVQFNDFS